MKSETKLYLDKLKEAEHARRLKRNAAEEMYEALTQAKEFVENLQLPDVEWARVLDCIVATLAKADGRKT